MSMGLKTTIALGGTLLTLMAVNTGANAQGANEYGNASGQPRIEWHEDTGPDGPVTFKRRGEERETYRETVEERNRSTSATGDAGSVAPKRKVRSGD